MDAGETIKSSGLSTEDDFDIRVNQNIFSESLEHQKIDNSNKTPSDPQTGQVTLCMESATFDCQFCFEKISGVSGLDKHLRNVHNAKISYSCHICQLKIWSVSLLKRHVRTHEKSKSGRKRQESKKRTIKRTPKNGKKSKDGENTEANSHTTFCTENIDDGQQSQVELLPSQQPEKLSFETSSAPIPSEQDINTDWDDFVNDDVEPNNDDDWGWDTDLNWSVALEGSPDIPAKTFAPVFPLSTTLDSVHVAPVQESLQFFCTECTEVFHSKQFYDIHQSYHKVKIAVDLCCPKCKEKFPTVESYMTHTKSAHKRRRNGTLKKFLTARGLRKKMRKIPCKECGHVLRSRFELKIHMQRHTGIKLYKCDECGVSFAAPSSLKRHQLGHQVALLELGMDPESPEPESTQAASEGEEGITDPQELPTPRVSNSGRNLRTLQKKHYDDVIDVGRKIRDSMEMSKQPVLCPTCGHPNRDQSELKIHMQTHTGVKLFKCHSCNQNCTTKNSLIRHIRLVHTDIRPHPCSHCSKTYPSLAALKNHQRYHARGKAFKCTFEQCGKHFALRTHLMDHMRRHTGERPYHCMEEGCGRAFMSSTELHRHNKSHQNNAFMENGEIPAPDGSTPYPYNCHDCDRGFAILDSYQRHRRIHDPNRKTYLCDLCGKKYFTKSSLTYHSISHEEEQTIPCTLCAKKFQTPYSLALHVKVHHERNMKNQMENTICDVCGKVLKSSGGLRSHMERHRNEKKYVCEQCGKGCATRGDLKFHMFTHFPVKPFKCEFCEYRCTHPSNINHHVAQDHMGADGVFKEINIQGKEKKFICFTCGEGWTDEKAFEHHQLYHRGEKEVPCKKCDERFITKYDLWIHAKIHRIPPKSAVTCKVCQKICTSKSTLESHMRYKHTGETPYPCPNCDRRFKSRPDLRYHSYTHTGNYPFVCSVCGKRAGSRGNLNVHMRTHQKGGAIKPEVLLRCLHCDKSFKNRTILKKHVTNHHVNEKAVDDEDSIHSVHSIEKELVEEEMEVEVNNDSSLLSVQPQEQENIQTMTVDNKDMLQGQDQTTAGFQVNYSHFFTTFL